MTEGMQCISSVFNWWLLIRCCVVSVQRGAAPLGPPEASDGEVSAVWEGEGSNSVHLLFEVVIHLIKLLLCTFTPLHVFNTFSYFTDLDE